MGGPHAKRKNSTGDKEDRSNLTDGQQKMAEKVDDLFERYKTYDKEEDSTNELLSWSDAWCDV